MIVTRRRSFAAVRNTIHFLPCVAYCDPTLTTRSRDLTMPAKPLVIGPSQRPSCRSSFVRPRSRSVCTVESTRALRQSPRPCFNGAPAGFCLFSVEERSLSGHTARRPTTPCPQTTRAPRPNRHLFPTQTPCPRAREGRTIKRCRSFRKRVKRSASNKLQTEKQHGLGVSSRERQQWLARGLSKPSWRIRWARSQSRRMRRALMGMLPMQALRTDT